MMDGTFLARQFIAWNLRALNPDLRFNEWEVSLSVWCYARRVGMPMDELAAWLYATGPGVALWDIRDHCLVLQNARERIAAEAAMRTHVVGEGVEAFMPSALANANSISAVLGSSGDHAGT